MDKKSILGFVVIGIILIMWMVWTSKMQKPPQENQPKPKTDLVDTTKQKNAVQEIQKNILNDDSVKMSEIGREFGIYFSGNAAVTTSENEKIITVESDLYRFEFSNIGGSMKRVYMKNFKTWDGLDVQLIDWKKKSELNLVFTSKDGKMINTKDLVFKGNSPSDNIDINKTDNFVLRYSLSLSTDTTAKIIKTYAFSKDKYEFDVSYELIKPSVFITDNKYQLMWGSALNLTEYRSDEEAQFSEAFAYMGGELEEMHPSDFDKEEKQDLNGNTDYVSTRNKYFGVFIIPTSRKADGAYLTGNKMHLPDEGQRNLFSIAAKMDIKNDAIEKSSFKILITPIDYKILNAYDMNLEQTMRFSLDFIVRPIAQYMILPFFNFLHLFIPNWGLVIIVFSIALKILLNPLTKKQMQSMRRMSALNPKMTAIREKYKDNPQEMNSKIMNLYKEEGINPASGCLPLLLQLPILYALFAVFRSTIELRQASFMLWITDLSAPDIIFHLPFKIPLFGIDFISGLATLMGITMFIQQKMTVTDPKQKALVYMMPIMMTLLFFSFPSGLNLYYFMFNLLSIAQQYYTTKINPPKDEEIKKPLKPTFMQKMMKRMQDSQKEMSKRRR
ncbi:MAG: membrane protein insertase YidC [Ignavibacteria bacterium]|nr:membrane protein insertase YidC [Ignavibacteria bacterium]